MLASIIGQEKQLSWVFQFWPVLAASFIAALAATALCKKIALKYGIVDKPDETVKTHKEPIAYLGASVRASTTLSDEHARWLASRDPTRPTILFSFGTYFSVHEDLVHVVAVALSRITPNVAFAYGHSPGALAEVDARNWLLAQYIPQRELLHFADLLVTHGGNNSLTEAFFFGVPCVVCPFASDQFAGAAAVEAHNLGRSLDPSDMTAEEVLDAIHGALVSSEEARKLARALRDTDGSGHAVELILQHMAEN